MQNTEIAPYITEKIDGRTYYTVTRASGEVEILTGFPGIAELFHGK